MPTPLLPVTRPATQHDKHVRRPPPAHRSAVASRRPRARSGFGRPERQRGTPARDRSAAFRCAFTDRWPVRALDPQPVSRSAATPGPPPRCRHPRRARLTTEHIDCAAFGSRTRLRHRTRSQPLDAHPEADAGSGARRRAPRPAGRSALSRRWTSPRRIRGRAELKRGARVVVEPPHEHEARAPVPDTQPVDPTLGPRSKSRRRLVAEVLGDVRGTSCPMTSCQSSRLLSSGTEAGCAPPARGSRAEHVGVVEEVGTQLLDVGRPARGVAHRVEEQREALETEGRAEKPGLRREQQSTTSMSTSGSVDPHASDTEPASAGGSAPSADARSSEESDARYHTFHGVGGWCCTKARTAAAVPSGGPDVEPAAALPPWTHYISLAHDVGGLADTLEHLEGVLEGGADDEIEPEPRGASSAGSVAMSAVPRSDSGGRTFPPVPHVRGTEPLRRVVFLSDRVGSLGHRRNATGRPVSAGPSAVAVPADGVRRRPVRRLPRAGTHGGPPARQASHTCASIIGTIGVALVHSALHRTPAGCRGSRA